MGLITAIANLMCTCGENKVLVLVLEAWVLDTSLLTEQAGWADLCQLLSRCHRRPSGRPSRSSGVDGKQIAYRQFNSRRLRSSMSNAVVIPATRLVVGDRAFPVASSRLWNSLPTDVTSATTLPVICSRLKTYLFSVSFPAWFVLFNIHSPSAFAVCINLRHFKYF